MTIESSAYINKSNSKRKKTTQECIGSFWACRTFFKNSCQSKVKKEQEKKLTVAAPKLLYPSRIKKVPNKNFILIDQFVWQIYAIVVRGDRSVHVEFCEDIFLNETMLHIRT